MKNLLLLGVAGMLLGSCLIQDGTLVIFNDTTQPECAPSLRIDAGGPFTVEVGDSVSFELSPGDYEMSLAGAPASGCEYGGDFAFDNQCTFGINDSKTTIIRMIDDGSLDDLRVDMEC